MTPRDRFREEPVPAARIEDSQWPSAGVLLERTHRQLKPETPGRGEQRETPIEGGAR
jgi:hypothetical protein